MNHSFLKDNVSSLCSKCKRTETEHGDNAQCEACPNIGPCDTFGKLLLCASCLAKEFKLAIEQTNERAKIYDENKIIEKAIKNDQLMETRQQYFNAETVAIVDIKKAIEEDNNIPADKKVYFLAKIVADRRNKFQQTLLEINEKQIELQNHIKAQQVYLNNLANNLRKEEIEELKIKYANYKPNEVTKIKLDTVKAPRMSREDKAINNYAKAMRITFEQAKEKLAAAREMSMNK